MWIVNFFPAWIFHALSIIGVIGLVAIPFLKNLPIIGKYSLPVSVVSVVILILGVYFTGAASTNELHQAKAKELEQRVQLAEEKAKTATAKVEYVFIDRVQKVKDVQIVVQEKLRDIAVNIDKDCKVSPEAVDLVNAAAKNVKPGEEK